MSNQVDTGTVTENGKKEKEYDGKKSDLRHIVSDVSVVKI